MANDHLEQSIGNIYLQDNETERSMVGQAYLEPKTRRLYVKIIKDSHKPYTIPKHRVIFEYNTNKYLLLENIYNEIPVFTGSIFTTNYSLEPCIETTSKEQALRLLKTGFNKLIVRIRARNNQKTIFENEMHKVTITQKAEVDDIYSECCDLFELKVNTSYSLEDGHLLTSGVTLVFDFKRKINVEYIDDIIKAFYIYFYLYHQGYDLIIDDIYIQSDEWPLKYYFDSNKYQIKTQENQKPPKSIVESINMNALSKIITSSINTGKSHRRIRNALNEFYEITSGQEIQLSKGCVLICSVIEKLVSTKKTGKARNKALKESIRVVLNAIEKIDIDKEVKDFYIDDPNKILGVINNKPFFERVEAFCNGNSIKMGTEDKEALSLVYKYRNELIHGQTELNEVDIAEKIQSKHFIEEKDEGDQKAYYFKYRTGAFHGVFTLTKQILMKWLERKD